MKNAAYISVVTFFSFLIYSCDQIPCDDVDCGEYGTCNEVTETCDCFPSTEFNETTGICECPENSSFSDSTDLCECNEGWIMNPLTNTCVNPCELINCGLNGSCDFSTGDCICDPGYGPGNLSHCEAYNLKFAGSWTGSHADQNSQSTGPYTMTLVAMQEPDGVIFENFMNLVCQGPQLPVDADGVIVSPGEEGGSISSVCPEWIVNSSSFSLENGSTLVVSATVTPGMGGPPMVLSGTYTRD